MKIHATFAWLVGAEGPSLIHAWDEYDVDENRAGYEKELAETLQRNEVCDPIDGKPMYRTVLIEIDYEKLERLFTADIVLEGELTDSPATENRGTTA